MNIKGMAFLCAFTVSAAFAEEDVVDTTGGLCVTGEGALLILR